MNIHQRKTSSRNGAVRIIHSSALHPAGGPAGIVAGRIDGSYCARVCS
jgi:hypothetical protein